MCSRLRRPLSVCFVGSHGCGKTSLIYSFGPNSGFARLRPRSRFGVSFENQSVVLENGQVVKFDCSEVEGYTCFEQAAVDLVVQRCTDACVIMYDLTSKDSYQQALNWMRFMRKLDPTLVLFFVGNKKDLAKNRAVRPEDVEMAVHPSVTIMETSANRPSSAKKLFVEIGWF